MFVFYHCSEQFLPETTTLLLNSELAIMQWQKIFCMNTFQYDAEGAEVVTSESEYVM